MTATKYFIDPFAQSGDLTPIPDNTQPSGAVSYNEGFTVNYQLPQTNPSALDVPRTQFNQLMNDITLNLQQYQQVGAPNFITAAQNGGSAFPYNKYSVVTYDDGTNGQRIFMSLINNNTNLPTVASAWWWIDFTSNSVVFNNASFDVSVANGDAVYWDTVSSKFKQALANGSTPQNVVGFADVAFSRVFSSGYVNLLTGLIPGSIYYLSSSTPGQITTVVPSTNIVQMGFAKSATELFVNIQSNHQSTSTFQAYFRVGITADLTGIVNTQQSLLPFNQIYSDSQSSFNTGTSEYTVNAPGVYKISLSICFQDTFPGGQIDQYSAILINSVQVSSTVESTFSSGSVTPSCEYLGYLSAGDKISGVYGLNAGGGSVSIKRYNDAIATASPSPSTYLEAIKIY